MAKYVHEIMNPELFSVRGDLPASTALSGLLALRITAAPVLDEGRHPIGTVSLRDLIGEHGGAAVAERLRPAATISVDATLDQAGGALDELDVHELVAVDRAGRAVGMVSSLDVMRALLGRPVRHPDAFPHADEHGISFSDPAPLDLEHSGAAPDGPGLLLLIDGEARRPEIPVWAEASTNVRTRIHQMLSLPSGEPALLARLLGSVFKAATRGWRRGRGTPGSSERAFHSAWRFAGSV